MSKILIILYLTLTVSFAHSTLCVLVVVFFGIAATWQPCTTCLHIPLLYTALQKFGNALENGVLDNIGMNPF